MSWYIDTTRIFVQDWKEVDNQIIPRLQPLSGGSVTQIFGYESPAIHFTALVVGMVDKEALVNMASDGVVHTISGPYTISGSYYVKSVAPTLMPSSMQTIRPDLDCYDPVYTIEVDLLE